MPQAQGNQHRKNPSRCCLYFEMDIAAMFAGPLHRKSTFHLPVLLHQSIFKQKKAENHSFVNSLTEQL